jgi:hypothetical protein
VSLRLRIDTNGKTIDEVRLNLDSSDKNTLEDEVAKKLTEMAAKAPLDKARQ